jgi:hypothetical protein
MTNLKEKLPGLCSYINIVSVTLVTLLFPFLVNISFIYLFVNNYLALGSRTTVALATGIPNNVKSASEEIIEDSQK